MSNSLSSQISRYGISESFIALIDGIRETPGLTEHKYRSEDVNKVAQYLVCRNYGKACLELSYLCWAVINHQSINGQTSPLIDFFWLQENITPKRFRHAFAQKSSAQASTIEINQDVLQLSIETTRFAISPTRVGALAVLLEFIVSIAPQQFNLLAEIESNLYKRRDNAIKSMSSSLQKIIYHYLTDHLIAAQQQRRLRYITQWLDSNKIEVPFLNDETLLAFWQQASTDKLSPGFKLYSSVFYEFIEAEQALKQAKASMAGLHAATIGFDVDNGEFSPDSIASILFTQSTDVMNYQWLCGSPKFLTKAQWAIIEPLHSYRPYLKKLSHSFARLFIFGQWQSVIVQAKRQSPQVTEQKLNELPTQDYVYFFAQLKSKKDNISAVILSLSYIFYSHQDPRFIGCLLDRLEIKKANELKCNIEQLVAELLCEKVQHSNLFAKVIALISAYPEMPEILKLAENAFKANNKEGFKQLPKAGLLDEYQAGADALQYCRKAVSELITQFSPTEQDASSWSEKFASDVFIFKEVFQQIYGGVHV